MLQPLQHVMYVNCREVVQSVVLMSVFWWKKKCGHQVLSICLLWGQCVSDAFGIISDSLFGMASGGVGGWRSGES